MKILLVEDNPGDAGLVRAALADVLGSQFELTQVGRLSEATGALQTERFDVLLLDLSLPDGHGLETLAVVRDAAGDVPIAVLTGLADEAVALRAVQAGAQDYLIKGAGGVALVRAMRYAIERQRMLTTLRSQSLVDDLTGLYNRRGFLALAEQQAEQARRTHDGFLLGYADLDGLKRINDELGHQAGDAAIVEAAQVLRAAVRDADIVARLGGDEFALLALGAGEDDAKRLQTRLEDCLTKRNGQVGRRYRLGMSLGLVSFDPAMPHSVDDLLASADARMYAAKRGKGLGVAAPTSRTGGPLHAFEEPGDIPL